MARMKFFVDTNRCISCFGCQVACSSAHELPVGIYRRKVITLHDGIEGKEVSTTIACQHCTDAPCEQVCPVDCFYIRADGIVLHDKHKCIGCGYCLMACPYGSITKGKDGKAQKCNLCAEKLERGEEPACVAGCPCGVLKLVDSNVSDSAGMQKEMPGFKHFFTKPNIRFYPRMKRNEFIH